MRRTTWRRYHDDIYLVGHTEVVAYTTSLTTEYTHAVSFIHHDAGIVLFLQLDDFRQWSQIAFHGEDAVYNNQLDRSRVALLQFLFQCFHVVVLILQLGSKRKATSVDDGCVVAVVADDVVLAVYKGWDNSFIHGKTGCEHQTVVLTQEGGQFFFQLDVKVECTVQESGTGASGTILAGSFNGGFDNTFVVSQSHV